MGRTKEHSQEAEADHAGEEAACGGGVAEFFGEVGKLAEAVRTPEPARRGRRNTLFSKKKRRKIASAAFGDGEARDKSLHVWIPAHREGVQPEVRDHRIGVGEGHLGRSLGGLARLKCGARKNRARKNPIFERRHVDAESAVPTRLTKRSAIGFRANKPAT